MNGPDDKPVERRYGVREVMLERDNELLYGVEYTLYPVDEPPMIEVKSVERRWYRSTWQSRGWSVRNAQ